MTNSSPRTRTNASYRCGYEPAVSAANGAAATNTTRGHDVTVTDSPAGRPAQLYLLNASDLMTRLSRARALFFFTAAVAWLTPLAGNAQERSCTELLQQAEQDYTLGRFDETIRLVDLCIDRADASETMRRLGYRLKGLSYIAKGLESDAREAVQRLLEVSPQFQVDPDTDPPPFIDLLTDVRRELGMPETQQPAAAAPGAPSVTTQQPRARVSSLYGSRNRRESWYTNWGLGIPFIGYPSELGDVLDVLRDAGVDNIRISLDLLGFYLPIGQQALAGVSVNAWGDRYDDGVTSLQINAYTFSLSSMYFLMNGIGDGLFVRAEVGPARLALDSSLDISSTSDWGFGYLVGAGYGLPITSGTRLLLHLTYSGRNVEGESYGAFGLSLSGLF